MERETPVRNLMTTDVLTFRPEDGVEAAARAMSERGIGGAPVVDGDGRVLGLLRDDDLIVQDARLHAPTVLSVLGAYIEWPASQKHFEADLRKAVGATVGDVMTRDVPTCGPDDTIERAATILHEEGLGRLAVVDGGGRLVGVVSRGDILRAIVTPAEET